MSQSRVQAFTISELLVVLVVSSILMTAALGIYSNLSRYQLRLKERVSTVTGINRVNFLIQRDLSRFPDMKLASNTLTVGDGTLAYYFFEDSVVREFQGVSETFFVDCLISEVDDQLKLSYELYDQKIQFNLPRRQAYADAYVEP